MRVLLDECVPARLSRDLPGHDVSTVGQRHLSGTGDGALLRRAAESFDVLITVDKSLQFQQAPVDDIALITVLSRSNTYAVLKTYAAAILQALDHIAPGDRIRIVSPD